VKLLDNAGWEALADCDITPAGARFTIPLYDIEYGDNPFFGDHLENQSWFEQLPEKVRSLPESSVSRARARR
jgi:hypothetical protein